MHEFIRNKEKSPFYKQLGDRIKDDIESGRFKHGDKLPSERELAEQFSISRMTARHALSVLEREGVVERRAGAGTFITNNRISMDFITFNSFSKDMLAKGFKPTTKKLSIRQEKAKLYLADKLKIEPNDEVTILRRVRLVDNMPISIEESFIPSKYCKGIEGFISDNTSLYQVLEDQYGIVLVKAKEYMKVRFPDESEIKLLKIGANSPCILREAVAFDIDMKEIEFSTSLIRSDVVQFYSELNL
ncbi:GntR family transcriptional regulator [Sporosarcina sp. E16_3]|uniref:GntR family transcriptional regulator n=1 Tax=Sporosarcina sp. E16_3 TaxID=2789293 RepID=UPI001A918C33|nr:GntR family transcriptional regulator [Sporosarcina sp. E16_3]MBO0600493.1 GntR family transcriptional regulator [Sporosarcina sp. E16_3]